MPHPDGTPTLTELQEEINQNMKREAFAAGYMGRYMPRYNSLTGRTCYRWFHVGVRWAQREERRKRLYNAVLSAYHRNHATRELEAHKRAITHDYMHLMKRRTLTGRRFR